MAGSLVAGCDTKPTPPKDPQGDEIKVFSVSPDNRDEMMVASEAEAARMNYRYRLEVLRAYYENVGNVDKYLWTGQELDNLAGAWTFGYTGLPEIQPPAGETIANADERVLVEQLFVARKNYLAQVEALEDFYRRDNRETDARLIANVRARLDPVRLYMYYFSAELPPDQARPVAVIPDAETLFNDGLKLFLDGKGILHMAMTTDYGKERQALLKFLELVDKYPTSRRVPESCYYIGDIYKEYFNENLRAVNWYRRAWQLDPEIMKPARFQAATVYDLRLQDEAQAVECYHGTIQHEQFNASNVRFARERIEALTPEQ
jgi:hypothetical protein